MYTTLSFKYLSILSVWQQLWSSSFDSPFSVNHLQRALFRLKFPASSSENTLPPSACIACTLLAIW
ncbi:hypothetical protein EDC94DRAFT_530949 [Helicostylum pulchrum]|nr:hypothetical protein EDC94DRAFT_530949 [Helicostylum pulchrum]